MWCPCISGSLLLSHHQQRLPCTLPTHLICCLHLNTTIAVFPATHTRFILLAVIQVIYLWMSDEAAKCGQCKAMSTRPRVQKQTLVPWFHGPASTVNHLSCLKHVCHNQQSNRGRNRVCLLFDIG